LCYQYLPYLYLFLMIMKKIIYKLKPLNIIVATFTLIAIFVFVFAVIFPKITDISTGTVQRPDKPDTSTPPNLPQDILPDLPDWLVPKSELELVKDLHVSGSPFLEKGKYGFKDCWHNIFLKAEYDSIQYAYQLILTKQNDEYKLYKNYNLISTFVTNQNIIIYNNDYLQDNQGLVDLNFNKLYLGNYRAVSISLQQEFVVLDETNLLYGMIKNDRIVINPFFDKLEIFKSGISIGKKQGLDYAVYSDGYYIQLDKQTPSLVGYGNNTLILENENNIVLYDPITQNYTSTDITTLLDQQYFGDYLIGFDGKAMGLYDRFGKRVKSGIDTIMPTFDNLFILGYGGYFDLVDKDLQVVVKNMNGINTFYKNILLSKDGYSMLFEVQY